MEAIETIMKQVGLLHQTILSENQVVSQLTKAIVNNTSYERKGRLAKKSLNSDKFADRHFVLERDQLFYFKSDKHRDRNFNWIILNNATIKRYNYDKSASQQDQPAYCNKKQPYILEIENVTRKYVLATKSAFDL
mgnify:CR=1 FL=1